MPHTIQNVIDTIIASVPDAPLPMTVDTVKCGDPGKLVTGIVTTFTATVPVLQDAVKRGANLVITHEPTFYNHWDNTEWLESDPVYEQKQKFLIEHDLVIWRFHDYWHLHKPDGIALGFLRELGWEQYVSPSDGVSTIERPDVTAAALAQEIKEKLSLSCIRIFGDPQTSCRRVSTMLGAVGGERQVAGFQKNQYDVMLCGETVEWQTGEYVRDSIALGYQRALIVLGHVNSEESGMRYLVEWLQPKFPDVPVFHIPAGDPITLI